MKPNDTDELLRYPIGPFVCDAVIDEATLATWIDQIESLPADLRTAVAGLSEQQLDTPYRPGGWTVRQVVHHLGDSHLNCYIRFKWALTEARPQIKAYDEKGWAALIDYQLVPIAVALDFLDLLHKKWVILLRALRADDLKREFIHPESGAITLRKSIGAYAWHGRHHLAHITSLRQRMQW